eukprot:tig00000381_g24526.t1
MTPARAAALKPAARPACAAADIVLTSPGLSVIISAIIGARRIFHRSVSARAARSPGRLEGTPPASIAYGARRIVHRMENYSSYSIAVTIRMVLSFSIIIFAWNFPFPPITVVILAFLNDGTIMTISKDRVKPSPAPVNWHLAYLFVVGLAMGSYLAASTIVFFATVRTSGWWQSHIGLKPLTDEETVGLIYLQISITNQALIFVTRSASFSWTERPGTLLILAFVFAQARPAPPRALPPRPTRPGPPCLELLR